MFESPKRRILPILLIRVRRGRRLNDISSRVSPKASEPMIGTVPDQITVFIAVTEHAIAAALRTGINSATFAPLGEPHLASSPRRFVSAGSALLGRTSTAGVLGANARGKEVYGALASSNSLARLRLSRCDRTSDSVSLAISASFGAQCGSKWPLATNTHAFLIAQAGYSRSTASMRKIVVSASSLLIPRIDRNPASITLK
jgi:hypothetical protein